MGSIIREIFPIPSSPLIEAINSHHRIITDIGSEQPHRNWDMLYIKVWSTRSVCHFYGNDAAGWHQKCVSFSLVITAFLNIKNINGMGPVLFINNYHFHTIVFNTICAFNDYMKAIYLVIEIVVCHWWNKAYTPVRYKDCSLFPVGI